MSTHATPCGVEPNRSGRHFRSRSSDLVWLKEKRLELIWAKGTQRCQHSLPIRRLSVDEGLVG